MKNTLDLVSYGPVIPVIVLNRVEDAVPMAHALVEGGVRVLEVTLRTPSAPRYTASRHQKQPPPKTIVSIIERLSSWT